jgi:acyl-CoA reductase-like NAD-dependent aldehyde dehydrogenase
MSRYKVVDPATGVTLSEDPTVTGRPLKDSIAAAARAFNSWLTRLTG